MTVTALNPGGVRNLLTRRQNVKAALERYADAVEARKAAWGHECNAIWREENDAFDGVRYAAETAGMKPSETSVFEWVEDYLSEGEE